MLSLYFKLQRPFRGSWRLRKFKGGSTGAMGIWGARVIRII